MNDKKPQLEDGYTRIANEILERLITINLSSYQTRVLLFVFRKTYGYGKKEDWISVSQIVEATGIHKAHVSRTKKELITRKIVTSNGNKIAFQKDSTTWQELPKQVTVTKSGNKVTSTGLKVTNSGQKLPVQADTKETIQKIITKDNINSIIFLFKEINPSYERIYSNKTERASLKRLVDKYGEQWVISAIKRLPQINSMPYAPKATTPYQLEIKLGQIKAFLDQEKNKSIKGGVLQL